MNEISQNLNLKPSSPPRIVAAAPDTFPTKRICSDEDLNIRMRELNKDIYQTSKNEKNKEAKTFLKWFGGLVAFVIGFRWIRMLF